MRHRVADLRLDQVLDAGVEETHLAHRELLDRRRLGVEDPQLVHLVGPPRGHELDAVALAQGAVDHAHHAGDAPVGVVPGVEEQGLQRSFGIALRRGQFGDDPLQHVLDADAGLGGRQHGVVGVDADHVLDLLLDPVRIGCGQVDLVDHRDEVEVAVDGQIGVGERLRLHPLGGVHHQERPLAGGQAARDLVGEVHVPWRVDEVELVGLAVLRLIEEAHGPGLDGDAPLPLQVHVVQELVHHVPLRDGVGRLQDTVGQGGFPVVDVGDDGEIADALVRSHGVGSGLIVPGSGRVVYSNAKRRPVGRLLEQS